MPYSDDTDEYDEEYDDEYEKYDLPKGASTETVHRDGQLKNPRHIPIVGDDGLPEMVPSHPRYGGVNIGSLNPKPRKTNRWGTGPHDGDFEDEDTPIWEQQPHETTLWYNRFMIYLKMGPGRTLRKTHAQSTTVQGRPLYSVGKGIPPQFIEYSRAWRWKERAEAWDRWQAEQDRATWEQERAAIRRTRIASTSRLSEIFTEILDTVDPEVLAASSSLQDIANALKTINNEFRTDYNDLPSSNTHVKIDKTEKTKVEVSVQGARDILLDKIERIAARKGVTPPTITELEPEVPEIADGNVVDGDVREIDE